MNFARAAHKQMPAYEMKVRFVSGHGFSHAVIVLSEIRLQAL